MKSKSTRASSMALTGGGLLLLLLVLAGQLVVFKPDVQAQGKGKNCQVAVNVTFRDSTFEPADRVRSDGQGTYFDDANISCDGNFLFLWGSGRTIIFDFTEPFPGSPNRGLLQAAGNLGVEIPATATNTTGLLGMAIGETAQTTKVQFNFVVGPKRYFLQLGSNYVLDTADVRRTGPNTWEIEAAPGDMARLQSKPAKGAGTLTTEGFYHVPFQMTLVKQ